MINVKLFIENCKTEKMEIDIFLSYQQSTSGPAYGLPLTISGDAYRGLPQNVFSKFFPSYTFDNPKSAICV